MSIALYVCFAVFCFVGICAIAYDVSVIVRNAKQRRLQSIDFDDQIQIRSFCQSLTPNVLEALNAIEGTYF